MKLSIEVQGLAELQASLGDAFSMRRTAATMATALTATALHLREVERSEMVRTLDRPTPYTLRGLQVKPATARDLTAEVRIADASSATAQGVPVAHYLRWQIDGGAGRQTKRFERALQAAGAMPRGWYAVPSDGARLDAFGNIDKGQLIQILSQLRAFTSPGYRANLAKGNDPKAVKSRNAALGRAGGQYCAVSKPGAAGKLRPGVYIHLGANLGKRQGGYLRTGIIVQVLRFVSSVAYARRYDFWGVARSVAARDLPEQLAIAIGKQMATLRKLGRL